MFNKRGIWLDNNSSEHKHDTLLNNVLIEVLKEKNIKTIIDFGCGQGEYAKQFINAGFDCECCDGNPFTKELSNGLCFVQDLSVDFNLNKKYDCVLCLEVGEHIPQKYESIFINNLLKHSNGLIILSWATIGQGGHGHVNEQPNEYIEEIFKNHNYTRNKELETRLRSVVEWWWFSNTIMIFEK